MARQRFDVVLTDGREFPALVISNRVLVEWDFERSKPGHNWPLMKQAPMLWANFCVYRQLVLNGELPEGMRFQEFREQLCDDIEQTKDKKDEEDSGELGNPTRQGQPPDSA